METAEQINKAIAFVKEKLANAETGHDWFHIERVWKLSKQIANKENEDFDELVVELASLLHDIADPKFHNGNEELAIQIAGEFLDRIEVDVTQKNHILFIIKNMSFKNSTQIDSSSQSIEFKIVQDADRLEAIGAIGIARAFHFGGYKNNLMYHPDIPPHLNMDKKTYMKSNGTTINHFYEKLLLLKDKMNTDEAKRIALERHNFMLRFLEEFDKEWRASF